MIRGYYKIVMLTSLPLKIKSAQRYLMSERKSSVVGPLAVISASNHDRQRLSTMGDSAQLVE
jgi:hypothetical protein